MKNKLLSTIVMLLSVLCGHTYATEPIDSMCIPDSRILHTVYSLETGGEHAFNTYLSPLPHTGWNIGLRGEWSRAMGNSHTWNQDIGVKAGIGFMENPAHNASMNDLRIALGWKAIRSFKATRNLTLGIGAGALLDAGMLYVARNSNNPVAARAYLGATLEGKAAYSFKIAGKSLRIIDEVSLPSLGIFFSPHFGQSYYEIYLGERDGLVRCGWWGNHFTIHNLTAIEIPVCRTRLRLGYRLEVMNSRASDINSRITTHNFVLGICTDWLNVTI